jgi:ABC-type antimicrobial peptide transport system permease subunit
LEVGVRKVMGAANYSLIGQFLIESVTITAIAGFIALALAQLCLPAFNQLTAKTLIIDYADPVSWAELEFPDHICPFRSEVMVRFSLSGRPSSAVKGLNSLLSKQLIPPKVEIHNWFSRSWVIDVT